MSVTITWVNPNTPPFAETAVHIYRSTTSMSLLDLPVPFAVLAANTLDYEDTDAVDGTEYYYRVGLVQGSNVYVSDEILVLAPTGGLVPAWIDITMNNVSSMAVINRSRRTLLGKTPTYVLTDWHSIRKLLTALAIVRYKGSVLNTETVAITTADITSTATEFRSGFVDGDLVTWKGILDLLLVPSKSDVASAAERVLGEELRLAKRRGSTAREAIAIAMEEEAARANCNRVICFSTSPALSGEVINTPMLASSDDVCRMMLRAYDDPVLQPIMLQTSVSVPVTGANPKTLTHEAMDRNILFKDTAGNNTGVVLPRYLAGKTGDTSTSGHQAFCWQTFGGQIAAGVVYNAPTRVRRQNFVNQTIMLAESLIPIYRNSEGAADPNAAAVAMRIKGNALVDTAPTPKTLTNFGVDTAPSDIMYGTALNFEVGDFVEVTEPFDFGTGDFTIEAFVQGLVDVDCDILSQWKVVNGFRGFEFGFVSGALRLYLSANGTAFEDASCGIPAEAVLANRTPAHLCAQRSGNSVRVFVNGVPGPALSYSSTVFNPTSTKTVIGARYSSTDVIERRYSGLIDELIVTKGVARYPMGGFIPYYRPNRWG